jgi:hypothetical protein
LLQFDERWNGQQDRPRSSANPSAKNELPGVAAFWIGGYVHVFGGSEAREVVTLLVGLFTGRNKPLQRNSGEKPMIICDLCGEAEMRLKIE